MNADKKARKPFAAKDAKSTNEKQNQTEKIPRFAFLRVLRALFASFPLMYLLLILSACIGVHRRFTVVLDKP